jgi:hypothetical protein
VTIKLKSTHFFPIGKTFAPKTNPGQEQPNFGEGFSASAKSLSRKIIFLSTIAFLEITKKWGENSGKLPCFCTLLKQLAMIF